MSKVQLLNGEVVEAKIVKAAKACPTVKMAVWQGYAGRCTTAVEQVKRGEWKEVA
jgi:hypothetical protein